MEISNLISANRVFCAVPISSKKKLLEFISQKAAKILPLLSEQEVFDAFVSRERLGSTGIGKGIALPHGRIAGAPETLCFLITTEHAINFDAIDNNPVQVFFALLVPQNEEKKHLSSLALIAETLSDKSLLKQLKHAQTNEELFDAITACNQLAV